MVQIPRHTILQAQAGRPAAVAGSASFCGPAGTIEEQVYEYSCRQETRFDAGEVQSF